MPSHILKLNRKGNTVFWAVTACLLWSTAYASIKLGLQYDKPFHFAGMRFIIAGLMILPFTLPPGAYIKEIRKNWKLVLIVTLLQMVVNYAFFYLGLQLVPGAIGAVIVGSQPLGTALIASMMDEGDKLTKSKIVTIIFGISGVILISVGRQALGLGSASELLGVGMILIANIGVSLEI